jgi:cytochrome b involved in lipid metabolism
MTSLTLGSLDDWHDFVSLHSAQIVIGAALSALTIYRKQLSSNRCFHREEENGKERKESVEDENQNDHAIQISDELEKEADKLLDGAGLYCSGAPMVSLTAHWLECFPGEDADGYTSKLWLMQNDGMETSDLLERAGSYLSLELIATMLFFFQKKAAVKIMNVPQNDDAFHDPFTNNFPPDIHVHIVSFLHPKDVATLSCVSKNYNGVVNKSETSRAIWKSLWLRDFAWIVNDWQVGRDALKRSGVKSWNLDKAFYFLFRQTYLNWIIAGENTTERCLVGLHNNIYDITSFLDTHPGSPDTLMVHAGKDSTKFFEDMGHSLGARRMAKSLCVVADVTASPSPDTGNDEWGICPTLHTKLLTNQQRTLVLDAGDNLLLGRKQQNRIGTLQSLKDHLEEEQEKVKRRVIKRFSKDPDVLGGEVNTYYDPFRREWRIWYTNIRLQNVFAPA